MSSFLVQISVATLDNLTIICDVPSLDRGFPSPAKVERGQVHTVGLEHATHLRKKQS